MKANYYSKAAITPLMVAFFFSTSCVSESFYGRGLARLVLILQWFLIAHDFIVWLNKFTRFLPKILHFVIKSLYLRTHLGTGIPENKLKGLVR